MKTDVESLLALVASAFVVVLVVACDGGREGERCNPNLSHDECNDGLTCQRPASCAENYCCPANASDSSNPYCNGAGCPHGADAAEATDAATDAASE